MNPFDILFMAFDFGWKSVLVLYLLDVHFCAVMHYRDLRDAGKLKDFKYLTVLAYVTLAVGLVLDFIGQLLVSAVFMELPRFWGEKKEWTVSARVWRLSNDPSAGWRYKVALFWRTQFLDPRDSRGTHSG